MAQGLVRGLIVGAALAWGVAGCEAPEAPNARPAPRAGASAAALPVPLVTGKSIDPPAGPAQNVGNIVANLIASPDRTYAVSTDVGYRQALWSIRASDGAGVSHIDFPKLPLHDANGLYYGLAFAPDGTLYAAQGNDDAIAVLHLDEHGTLTRTGQIKTRSGDFPAGLALDDRGRLYVTHNDPVAPPRPEFSVPGSMAIYDAREGRELGRYAFADSFGGTPNFPLGIAVLRDGSKAYVGSERDAAVYVLNTADPAHIVPLHTIATGAHPISLLLNHDQSRLFVSNAQSDTVSVIDTAADRVIQTILLRPEIAKDVAGATPLGLAMAPDERTLYVAMGDLNAVAVIDVARSELLGYLPAGWYPTAVVTSADGTHLLVANAKGTEVRHPNPPTTRGKQQSPIALIEGNVLSIAVPPRGELAAQTQRVLELARLTPPRLRRANPLASIGLPARKVQHVIYIVKENRTYDQVLGDIPRGNGDPSRCLFGRDVTPNQHALAERFVLLDNFYDCGEVSGDGWTWSTQAQAGEYIERNVPYSYSGRGRDYDYEGTVKDYPVGGFPAMGPDGKPLSDDPRYHGGAPAVPDVGEAPGGHIWDLVRKAGLSYRNYGFFLSDPVRQGGRTIIPDNYPSVTGLQPGGHDLAGISDVDFRMFDLNYPDSEIRVRDAEQTHDEHYLRPMRAYGAHRAPSRFSEWHHEFEQMLAKAPDGSAVPNFMTVRFCMDHTMGTNPRHHSPRSMVADNDFAVGQLVEAVSHSPIWTSTAIFIIEDDAQNGPDHVDAHRSTCYVISPWIKPHSVDHTFQNTTSVLRTMELLLGLGPMCQYDAAADPIMDWSGQPDNAEPYTVIEPAREIIREINGQASPREPVSPEQKAMMDESSRMDFAHADRAPADRLSEIIWKSVKGPAAVMPPTPHGPPPTVPRAAAHKDDDDD